MSFLAAQGKREMGWVLAIGDLPPTARKLCETKPETLDRDVSVSNATPEGRVHQGEE